MAFSGLEALTRMVDKLEEKWDKEIEEQLNKGNTKIMVYQPNSIDEAVYEELQKRYEKAGFSISQGKGERQGYYNFNIISKDDRVKKPKI